MPQRRTPRSKTVETTDTTIATNDATAAQETAEIDATEAEIAQDEAQIERERRAAFAAEVAALQEQQQAQDADEAHAAQIEHQRAHDAEAVLAEYANQLAKLRVELEQRRAHFDEMEAEELARADTPLSYDPMITSCNFATITYVAGESIPRFSFPGLQCIRGKTRPDQDCRTCCEVKLVAYGSNLPPHRRRYLRHGLVFPLRTNEDADAIITTLNERGIRPLRSLREELNAIEQSIAVIEAQQEQERREDLERRQGKRF